MGSKRIKNVYLDIEAEESYSSEYEDISEDIDGVSSSQVSEASVPKRKDWNTFTDELVKKYHHEEEEDGDEEDDIDTVENTFDIAQHLLVPDIKSPRLWIIRVKRGKERDVALKILSRCYSASRINTVVDLKDNAGVEQNISNKNSGFSTIFSVVVKPDLFGYIYVEAYSKAEVIDTLSKIRSATSSRISPVPLNEMIDVLTIKPVEHVKPYSFARVRKGKYRNDIVQVINVVTSEMVNVRIVPRLKGEPKLFNCDEVDNVDVQKKDGKTIYIYKRETYIDGFLHKEIMISNLILNVEVSFNETRLFVKVKKFNVNDQVRVKRGDLINLKGIILNVDKDEAEVNVKGETFVVPCDDLEKFYNIGDNVSVKKRNGTVISIDGSKVVVLFTDKYDEQVIVNMDELEPLSRERKYTITKQVRMPMAKRDPLLNKQVEIKIGEYKGYNGVVKDVYKDNCRILLNSNLKYVNVTRDGIIKLNKGFSEIFKMKDKNNNIFKEEETSKFITNDYIDVADKKLNYSMNDDISELKFEESKSPGFVYKNNEDKTPSYKSRFDGGKTPYFMNDSGRTSNYGNRFDGGGKTPNFFNENGKTPNYNSKFEGGKTPNFNRKYDGFKTPNFNNESGRTPNYGSRFNGGKTPNFFNEGGKTPNFNSRYDGCKTPNFTNESGRTPNYSSRFNGGKTPNFMNENGKTPKYGNRYENESTMNYSNKYNGSQTPNYSNRFENESTINYGNKYNGSQTPNYSNRFENESTINNGNKYNGSQTPNYSNRFENETTLNYNNKYNGSQTPNYSNRFENESTINYNNKYNGSQTPNYGSYTPGSRTPNFKKEYNSKYNRNTDKTPDYDPEYVDHKNKNPNILKKILIHPNNNKNLTKTIKEYKNGKYILDDNTECNSYTYVMPELYEKIFVVDGKDSGTEGILIETNGNKGKVNDGKGNEIEVDLRNVSKSSKY